MSLTTLLQVSPDVTTMLLDKGLSIALLAVAVTAIWKKSTKDNDRLFDLSAKVTEAITQCSSAMNTLSDTIDRQNTLLETKIDNKFKDNREALQKIVNDMGEKLADKLKKQVA